MMLLIVLITLYFDVSVTVIARPSSSPKTSSVLSSTRSNTVTVAIDTVYVDVGPNVGNHVRDRVYSHLHRVKYLKVFNYEDLIRKDETLDDNSLILSLGNTNQSQQWINQTLLEALPFESFCLTSLRLSHTDRKRKNVYVVAVDGRPLDFHSHQNISFDKNVVHYGAVVGTYAALEYIGLAFLHPLEPHVPSVLTFSYDGLKANAQKIVRITTNSDAVVGESEHLVLEQIIESPKWPERVFHIHTQHPLELTEVLQGHDIPQFGPHGPHCKMFNRKLMQDSNNKYNPHLGDDSSMGNSYKVTYCERWEDMVADVDLFFEWAIANRQNKVEWLLLGNYKWGDELETRLHRLKILTSLGHKYSLMVGADCPIGNIQQHAWYMVDVRLPIKKQAAQIRERVDWIFSAGFDFLTTESGLSEFTHPECDLMLDLMNVFAEHVNVTWGREAGIKVHCSTGQTCENFLDPRTGDPINFNFLPSFAHTGLGVFPHTVQMYALDDPTAGAYGNDNFSYIEDYIAFEAKKGERSVVFYGETAYWVNVDVDVPLFLPIYAQRRQYDLRKIALREQREGFHMHGQMNFDSGWEWGYWLSDVVTARAVWDPMMPSNFSDDYQVKEDQWEVFADSLTPITRIFGIDYGEKVKYILVELAQAEADLLIYGKVNGEDCPNLDKLSGIAYMSGTDTWVDIPRMFGMAFLQADKVHMKEVHDKDWNNALRLLREMDKTFSDLSRKMTALLAEISHSRILLGQKPSSADSWSQKLYSISLQSVGVPSIDDESRGFFINDQAFAVLEEFEDAMKLLALRAHQQRLLYEAKDPRTAVDRATSLDLLRRSRGVLQEASEIVRKREAIYKVPWQRIASWRDNPTTYRYGYLWAVHSLFYWWRDQGIAEEGAKQTDHSPCYLNRMDVTEIAVGWGQYTLELFRTFINRFTPLSYGSPLEFVNCLSPPPREYVFPKDLFHFE